jgi:hypothetical protein
MPRAHLLAHWVIGHYWEQDHAVWLVSSLLCVSLNTSHCIHHTIHTLDHNEYATLAFPRRSTLTSKREEHCMQRGCHYKQTLNTVPDRNTSVGSRV